MIERKRIKNRRNNAAGWVEDNPILLSGEFGIELDSTPIKMKIGDGMTPWNDLPYTGASESEIIEIIEETTYTKQEVDTALNDKADKNNVYTKQEIDTALNGKADKTNVYTKQEIDTALNGKADKTNVYTKQEVDTIKQTIENEIPAKTSDLTNDSGFITINDVPAQVNADWNAVSGVSQILNKPTIPTKTSDLTNDSGFITSSSVPTKTSDLTNDSGFITISDVPAQAQSDWNQSDSTAVDYIKNKPVIPTVGDGTITIKQGNVTKGSFTTNQSGDTTITIDEGGQFTQQQADWNQADSTAVDYIKNKPVIPAAPVQSNWNESDNTSLAYIQNKPTIPTKTSDITNDSGYITISDVPTQVNADWNSNSGASQILNKPSLFSGDYNDLTNKPTIPTKTSDLTNDSGFITISDVPAQAQSDWNQADSTAVDFIKNKPTIPAAPVQSNWNESDSTSLAYIQNKPTIPAAQVQSDWNQADSTAVDFIKNKPTIPTVNDGTFTIQKNGTTVASFTANDSSNKTANITVPTDETDLGLSSETWTFTLSDNTTVSKEVILK